MSIFSKLFGRKETPHVTSDSSMSGLESQEMAAIRRVVPLDMNSSADQAASPNQSSGEVLSALASKVDVGETNEIVEAVVSAVGDIANDASDAASSTSVNIWDLDDEAPNAEVPASKSLESDAASSVAPARERTSPARRRRNKTRLLGFEKSDGQVVDLFNNDAEPAPSQNVKFPVGWIVVVDGPGEGACFTLLSGMSQIGRGEDQTVQLDFGDNSISRTNHAAIVYDPENFKFLLGHGGKSNLVRLNDSPIISNEMLSTGDKIRIGETTLHFTALCTEEFNWSQSNTSDTKGNDDVEIA